MIDIEKYNKLKNDVTTRKEELKNEFTAKNENIVKLQKKRDDLYQKYGLKSPDLNTSDGLYQVASQNGLEDKAKQVIRDNSGEEYKQIFSGGFISDIFDVLNVVSYGTVGILKGKGFADGVKNRESFADADAMGQYGLAGTIAGIALDIAFDPFTYIAPWTAAKKIPGVAKGVKAGTKAIFGETVEKSIQVGDKLKKVANIEGGTNAGKWTAEKLSYMFGADKSFKDAWYKRNMAIGIGTRNTDKTVKMLSSLDKEAQGGLKNSLVQTVDIGERTVIERVPIDELHRTLGTPTFEKIKPIYDKMDKNTQKLIDLGVLSKEKGEENLGKYLKQSYENFLDAKGNKVSGGVGIQGTKQRVEKLSEKAIENRIEDPAFLFADTLMRQEKDIADATLLNQLAKTHALDKEAIGYTKMSGGKKLGSLADKYVPDYIAKYITPEFTDLQKSKFEKNANSVMGLFKVSKVLLSPGALVRNGLSNMELMHIKLGIPPGHPDYLAAAKELKTPGKWTKIFEPVGYKAGAGFSYELNSFKAKEGWSKGIKNYYNKIIKTAGNIYGGEEDYFKLTSAINTYKKGASAEEAWKAAESALFNYSEVTPFIKNLRTAWYGVPFATFTVKATPIIAEGIVKHPARISYIGKIKNAIEEMSDIKETEKERASEPQWIKDGFFVKLPIKDKEGRSAYFDLTYILPFGDLVSGQFLSRNISRETGVKESIPSALLSKNPALNFIKEISKNQDFTGNKIWKDSDSWEKQLLEIQRHLFKSLAPPPIADQIPGGYNSKNERVQSGIYKSLTPDQKDTQKRTVVQELLKNFGMKIQPVNSDIQESMNEWQKKKGIGTLLSDENVIKEYSSFYQPK